MQISSCYHNGHDVSLTRSQARHANPLMAKQQPSASIRGACSVSAAR